jgi:LCP family protein required for cell wall assembly
MNRPHSSIDGFTLRRRTASTQPATPKLDIDRLPVPEQFLQRGQSPSSTGSSAIDQRPMSSTLGEAGTTAASGHLVRDIDDSLRAIDDERPAKPRRRLSRKALKRIGIVLILIAALGAGYVGIKAFMASGSVFNGNLFDVFSNKQLKKDSYGRSNILLFGTSEDSQAHMDQGAGALTDSIMVLSVDQDKKNAIMFSVPRDLWVDYGRSCLAGYSGKINALYECAKDGASDQTGANALKQAVGEVFGIDIQYYAKVNYSALKDAVNAVDGITVTIDSDDSRGIYDPNFDWQCGATRTQRIQRCPPDGHLVDYENGPVNLDGEHALALARARNAAGGYGLSGGNFDREQYQQKIILAIKEKAVSAGTLANPVKVGALIDSVGKNIETNFETSEIKTLVDLASAINKSSIRSISLVDKDKPLVTTANYSGQSIVRPVAGLEDFSKLQSYIQSQFSGTVVSSEDATIEILNGTDLSGVASKKEAELESRGIIVTSIGDAPTSSSYGAVQWFDTTSGQKPKTAQKLLDVLGEANSGSSLPSGVQSDADFVIIIGQ